MVSRGGHPIISPFFVSAPSQASLCSKAQSLPAIHSTSLRDFVGNKAPTRAGTTTTITEVPGETRGAGTSSPYRAKLEKEWEKLGDGVATNIMIRGLHLEFHTSPRLTLRPHKTVYTSRRQSKLVMPFAEVWLKRNYIREIFSPMPLFFSRMFTVPKKKGEVRPFIDLSALNRLLCIPHFRMETIAKIAKLVITPMWGTTTDITDAYLKCPNCSRRSGIFCICLVGPPRQKMANVSVLCDAIRPVYGSVGVHKDNEANHGSPPSSRDNSFCLPGRLLQSSVVSSVSCFADKVHCGIPGVAGFLNQPQEIPARSLPTVRVFGSELEPGGAHAIPPGVKGSEDSGSRPLLATSRNDDQEGDGKRSGFPKFATDYIPLGRLFSVTNHSLDEQSIINASPGHPDPSGSIANDSFAAWADRQALVIPVPMSHPSPTL